MPKIIPKVSIMIRAYIWLYRILFITFGGITVNSTGKISINKYLKYYGYFNFTALTTVNILGFIYFLYSEEMIIIYKLDPKVIYYMVWLTTITQIIHMTANVWYLNLNGFTFFEIFSRHQMLIKKNKFILTILWVSHILIPVLIVIYNTMTSDLVKTTNLFYAFLVYLFQVYSFIAIWAVSFLTWITSFHFYELLIEINQNLRRDLIENPCNFNTKQSNKDLTNSRMISFVYRL